MAQIRITLDDTNARRLLRKAAIAVRSFRPAMEDIGHYLTREADKRFKTEKDPDGNDWAELTVAYSKRKSSQRRAIQKKLQVSGRLRASIIYQATDDEVSIGTNAVYARRHQLGGGGIPARPFLGVNDDDQREIGLIISDYINDSLK